MPTIKQRITPFLWFDTEAEEAARFYTSVFENSRITRISRYGKAGRDVHGKEPGSIMTVAFELDGQAFVALNGGPHFKFNEAISFLLRHPGRNRLFLEQAVGRRPRESVRLAERQIRRCLADRAIHPVADDGQRRPRKIRASDGCAAENEKVRSGNAAARLRGTSVGRHGQQSSWIARMVQLKHKHGKPSPLLPPPARGRVRVGAGYRVGSGYSAESGYRVGSVTA